MAINPALLFSDFDPRRLTLEPGVPVFRAEEVLEETVQEPFNAFEGVPDADAFPLDVFIPEFPVTGQIVGNFLRAELDPRDLIRQNFQTLRLLQSTPGLQLANLPSSTLPSSQVIKFEVDALKKLMSQFEAEIEKLTEELKHYGSLRDPEELRTLSDQLDALRKRLTEKKEERKELDRDWNQRIASFYKRALQCALCKKDDDFADLQASFHQLRQLRPLSLAPFYPWLTVLIHRVDPNSFGDLIEDAKWRDPYLTYALVVQFFRRTFYRVDPKQELFQFLTILQRSYPEDLFLPPLIAATASGSTEMETDFSPVMEGLNTSLTEMALGNIDQGLQSLVRTKPLLVGFSIIHRLIALAWTLKGDVSRADEILERAEMLPDLGRSSLHLWQIMSTLIGKQPETPPKRTLLFEVIRSLIEFVKNEKRQDPKEALKLINGFYKALESDCEALPFIYFGIKKFASEFVVAPNDFERYRPLFNALFELMGLSLRICLTPESEDPWLKANIKRVEEEDGAHFIIRFSELHFGERDSFVPSFEFRRDLSLTEASEQSISTAIVKQTYFLLMGLMLSHQISHLPSLNVLPADNPTLFLQIVRVGFTDPASPFFPTAVSYLRNYLNLAPENRPYSIAKETIDWAIFVAGSLAEPSRTPDALDSEVAATYRLRDLPQEEFNRLLVSLKRLLEPLIPAPTRKTLPLAKSLQETLFAISALKNRSELQTLELPNDQASFYAVFRAAQDLFGWRVGESFEAWGDRLKANEKRGPAALEIYRMDEGAADPLDREGSPEITASFGSKNVKKVLQLFLQFWLEFHQTTADKNRHISEGGDEEKAGAKVKTWESFVSNEQLLSLVYGKEDPLPKLLASSKEREQFVTAIGSKREHAKEFEKLKEIYGKEGFSPLKVAALDLSAKCARNDVSHSLVASSEEEARHIYQVFLEMGVERIIRRELLKLGAEGWGLDVKKAQEVLIPSLKILVGKFHGPEQHFSGEGPLQWHYNAPASEGLENTHLYF